MALVNSGNLIDSFLSRDQGLVVLFLETIMKTKMKLAALALSLFALSSCQSTSPDPAPTGPPTFPNGAPMVIC